MRESQIEEYLVDRVKSIDGIAYKFTSPQRRNVPDRLIALMRRPMCLVELKATGQTPTKAQAREHTRLRERGMLVFVIDSLEGVDAFIDWAKGE